MYQKSDASAILRSDGAVIPADPDNTDYALYLVWVSAGNTATPYVAPQPPVPSQVTMRQARLALLGAGVLAGVDAFIDSLSSPQKEASRIEWEYAATVDRDSALVGALSVALSLDGPALDALFIAASEL